MSNSVKDKATNLRKAILAGGALAAGLSASAQEASVINNYEATQRGGIYGAVVANTIDIVKEAKDIFYNKYPVSDSLRDYRANLRGNMVH